MRDVGLTGGIAPRVITPGADGTHTATTWADRPTSAEDGDVLLVDTTGQTYRWDDAAGQWTDGRHPDVGTIDNASPGNAVGELVQAGGETYRWDGSSWIDVKATARYHGLSDAQRARLHAAWRADDGLETTRSSTSAAATVPIVDPVGGDAIARMVDATDYYLTLAHGATGSSRPVWDATESAIHLNSSTSHLEILHSHEQGLGEHVAATASYAMMLQVSFGEVPESRAVLWAQGGADAPGFELFISADADLCWTVRDSTGSTLYSITADTALRADTWHTIIVTADGEDATLHIDGEEEGSTEAATDSSASVTDPMRIGRAIGGSDPVSDMYCRAIMLDARNWDDTLREAAASWATGSDFA